MHYGPTSWVFDTLYFHRFKNLIPLIYINDMDSFDPFLQLHVHFCAKNLDNVRCTLDKLHVYFCTFALYNISDLL